jgi:hypothetical protein
MRKTQKFAIVGGTVSALLIGGVAYAAWTSSGTGDGAVTAGHATTLGVSGAPIGGLYPTKSVTQQVTVTNSNPYAVTLTDLTPNNLTVASDHPLCNASSVTAATVSSTATLAALTGSTTIPVTVSMDNTANDACQDATFTISYTAHGASS